MVGVLILAVLLQERVPPGQIAAIEQGSPAFGCRGGGPPRPPTAPRMDRLDPHPKDHTRHERQREHESPLSRAGEEGCLPFSSTEIPPGETDRAFLTLNNAVD